MTAFATLIAEDEPLARDSLALWVQQLPQLQLVASVGDGVSALQAIRQLRPALVLMDIQMPGLTGLQVLRALAADAAAAQANANVNETETETETPTPSPARPCRG